MLCGVAKLNKMIEHFFFLKEGGGGVWEGICGGG